MRRALLLLCVGLFGVGAFLLGRAVARHEAAQSVPAVSVIDQVRAELAHSYYRRVPPEILRMNNVESMIAALNDPYTEYLDPVRYRLLRQETSSSYSGIGLAVVPSPDGLLVTTVAAGPARAAGVRTGDTIVGIDGKTTKGVAFETALGRILGPEGTRISLTVLRGSSTLEFRLARRKIAAPIVRSRLLSLHGRRVGYLRLAAFRTGAAQILRAQLRRLQRAGVSALVLDLRANPGGLLDQAVAVTSLFLDRGLVVSVESAHRHREAYSARRSAATRLRLVVLVDRYSASSAEVVAAALHDNHRAVLVGESTFGKALVQSVLPLTNGAALKLTTAHYLTPSGVDISHDGVAPDVSAVDDPNTRADEGLAAALLVLETGR